MSISLIQAPLVRGEKIAASAHGTSTINVSAATRLTIKPFHFGKFIRASTVLNSALGGSDRAATTPQVLKPGRAIVPPQIAISGPFGTIFPQYDARIGKRDFISIQCFHLRQFPFSARLLTHCTDQARHSCRLSSSRR